MPVASLHRQPPPPILSAAIASELAPPYLRVINAAPDTPLLELHTEPMPSEHSVEYGAMSEYVAVHDAWIVVEASVDARQGEGRTATAVDPLRSGEHYSAVVFRTGNGSELAARVISDAVPSTSTTRALVRLVSATPAFSEVSLYLADRHVELLLYPDQPVGAGFLDIEPYNGPVELREGGRVLKTLSSFRLDAGSAHTFVFLRDAHGRTNVFALHDRPAQAVSRR